MAGFRANGRLDKSRIVEEGNYHKFTKCKESAQMSKALLDTGDREMVEVGLCALDVTKKIAADYLAGKPD